MANPGVSLDNNQMIKTLEAHLKNPNDKRLIGNSSKLKIGLTRMFNPVRMAPATRKELNPPLILNAGITTVKTYKAMALIRNDFNIFFTDNDFIRSGSGVQTVILRLI